jgi:surface polysaccharide O-acyltransferase-like enzyme
VAIAGVVIIHVVSNLVSNEDWQGTRRWWVAVAIDIGAVWVVPVFVMISGALVLAPRAHEAGPGAFYRKRFARLLPALVLWHVVYLLVVRVGLRGQELSLPAVTQLLIDGKVYIQLYFLWLIAGLYVIAPVLAAFLRDGGRRRAMIMAGVALSWTLVVFALVGVAQMAGLSRPIWLGSMTRWWPYVGYFLAGWALHRLVLKRRGIAVAALVVVAGLAEMIWQYGTAPAHPTLDALLPVSYLGGVTAAASIAVFLIAIGIGARYRPGPRVAGVLVRLSDASFGVFLIHLLIFEVIRRFVPAVAQASSLGVLLTAYAVTLVLSFAISIGASKVPWVRAVF